MKTNKFSHFWQYFIVNFNYYAIYHLFIGVGLILTIAGYSFLLSYYKPQTIEMFLDSSFWTLINICGIILTTSAFSSFGKKSSAFSLLTLPVSSLTRFATAWIYSIPLLFITATISYTLIANGVALVFSSMNFVKEFAFNPFQLNIKDTYSNLWSHCQTFLIIQSIMLMAGSFFTRFGFIKSILTITGVIVLYTICNLIFLGNSLGHQFVSNFINILTTDNYQNRELLKLMPIISIFWQIAMVLVIPFTWYIGYLRIKEMEA